MDLTTATPAAIDTVLAEIYGRLYKVTDQMVTLSKHIEDMEDGIAKAEEFAGTAQALRYSCYNSEALARLLLKHNILSNEHFEIREETRPYNEEFTRRGGWSRFFLVANNGGHIHSSMGCTTCYPTTQFGWLPEFSGQTEAEAVAKHGAILCTVCYPSAPTEWTDGKKPGDENVCIGSGEYLHSDLPHRSGYAYGNWATCSQCGSKPALTKGYRVRKHTTGQVFN